MSSKTLYIVDAHAHIYASYYAIRALSSPAGEPTNAVHGFTSILLALLRDRQPSRLVVVFDPPGPVFRHELYDQYKATRQPMPEDLPAQIKRIHQVLDALGIATISLAGFEADDVIASLARRGRAEGFDVFMCTKDKDLEAIIGDGIAMYDCRTSRVVDAAALLADKGYHPHQARDVLALTGDTSDNIPGVPGVGPKTAAKLLAEAGTLDHLLANLDRLPQKMADKLRENLPRIEISRKLVELREDLELPADLLAREPIAPKLDVLIPLFLELGFKRFLEQLKLTDEAGAAAPRQAQTTAADCDYRLVDTPEKLAELVERLSACDRFAFDTETDSLDSLHCGLVGLSFSWADRTGWYVPVQSRGGAGVGLPLAEVVAAIKGVMENPAIGKIGHHCKFDIEALQCAGVDPAGVVFDTMIASYLLDPESNDHKLDSLALGELGHQTIPITDLIGKGKNQLNMRDVPLERIAEYAAEDADVTWRLAGALAPRIAAAGLDGLMSDLEMPLAPVLARMERAGVSLDVALLEGMGRQMEQQAGELTRRIHECVGEVFNIDSPKQLAVILFDKLGLRAGRKTKTGYSTDVEVLEQLGCLHEAPRLVLEYRQLVKLKGTYVDTLPRLIHPDTGRVHPTFTQTRTATGRLACQEPNLQNIPIRTAIGRQIRGAFVPGRPDEVMLTADYSQIELRMLAHFSEDPALCQAFAEDQDIHTFVASQVFGVLPAMVDPEQRRRAKAVNFGIIYGQTPFGLAKALGISQSEAAEFIDAYFKRYGTIRRFLNQCIVQARDCGYATTILGRRRPIPDINSRNKMRRTLAERTAVNTVTQGSAADLIKQAMINIDRRIREEHRPSRMLIQVHDELVFEVAERAVEAEAEMVRREMTGAISLKVPLKVDVAWGKSWLEAK